MQIVHLHVHDENSLLDGVGTTIDWVKRAKELGMPAIAITNHGNINSAQQLIFACKQEGIKPIIGYEAYIVDNMKVKKHKEYRNHVTLLAKNTRGYYNLIKLVSIANIDGFYKKPRIDFNLLKEYSEGIIVLSGCFAGTVYQAIFKNDKDAAILEIEKYKNIFGKDYYIEIMLFPNSGFKEIYPKIANLARLTKTPMVLTNDCHYIYNNDSLLQDVLFMVKKKQSYKNKNKVKNKILKFSLRCLWLKTLQDILKVWKEHYSKTISKDILKEAIENTNVIANKIEEYNIDKSHKYPAIFVDNKQIGKNEIDKLLKRKAIDGWKDRGFSKDKHTKYYNRLRYELSIIINKGMSAYFLILADVVNWAKQKNILVGYGRGSVAGCLLAYLLGIHNVDPIKHKLLFERFVNESSDNMPDIDVDFDARYRDDVKHYLIEKYGNDKVGEIATYGMMKLKMAIKDIARVYGFDYRFINDITKQIGNNEELNKEEINKLIGDLQNKEIIVDLAMRLQGQTRHISIHPAGLVITPTELTNYLPLQRYKNKIITGWTEGIYRREITSLGLVKYDILGLKTLSVVADCIKLVRDRHKKIIKLDNIPLNDDNVFKNYRKDLVAGIFQCESSTMRGLIKHLKPKEFEDIIALLAIDRPAPLSIGIFDKFLNNRKDKDLYKKFNPIIWKALKETHGVLLYQEQVINLTKLLGDFNVRQRLTIKKLLKKPPKGKADRIDFFKKQDNLGKLFIERASKKIDKNMAENLWDDIKAFGSYGFNRSHSCSYALLSYATMWLKTYYSLEFYTSLLNHTDDENKIDEYRKEMNNVNINLLKVDINKSKNIFSIEENNIRYGFLSLKGIGKSCEGITSKQPYASAENFLEYAVNNKSILNKRVVLALIKSGAFSSFCSRGLMLHKYRQKVDKKYIGKCINLNLYQKLEGEKDVYGFYFTDSLTNLLQKESGGIELSQAIKQQSGNRIKLFAKVDRVYSTDKALFINISLDGCKSVIVGWKDSFSKFKDKFKAGDLILADVYRMNYKGKKEFLIKENSNIKNIGECDDFK